jgi:hypothetical protein
MASALGVVEIYRKLAEWHHNHGQPQQRDRFLLLAAHEAEEQGRSPEANAFMQRLIRLSPHHMVKPFATFALAMQSPDVRKYLDDLRRACPPEKAESMLVSLQASKENTKSPPPVRQKIDIPPTQPVIDLDQQPVFGNDQRESFKVYRIREETAPSTPPAPRSRATRSDHSNSAPTNAKASWSSSPVPAVPLYSLAPSESKIDSTLAKEDYTKPSSDVGESDALGNWLCLLLAALVTAAAMAFVGIALILPLFS